ncbi:threonine ammonia-lyase [Lampropedia puyangensis]|uniref:L-threonine dehydratase catabolic TdcB n=1 Tax=Lampropedia puyangensis TaxID=1330072 RepID=A0A4S8FC61_9BURK|nr:threonine ammonia-lyase [Lampropedia puyangensis]THU04445.1 threonine ammonia-lyase [Lampropedia puyangensis]
MLDFQAILAAKDNLQGQVLRTPFVESRTLSQIVGAQLFLKFENLQFTASFKERGACNKMVMLTAQERARGVIAMSAGNHAQGVAYHAQRLGIRAVIVMPTFAPSVKVERTRGFGAQVVLHGDDLEQASARAFQIAQEQGLTFVHPYDDEAVAAGQGTLALEMLEEEPDLDVLITAVGGGGLLAGVATAARHLKPDLEIVGVQASRFPAMVNAIQGTQHPQGLNTMAEGIAVAVPGQMTRVVLSQLVDRLLLVEESDIEQAVLMLLEIEKTLVEGAGAASLAAVLRHPEHWRDKKIGLVLSGGNIEPLLLASIIERGMVKTGRLARIRVGSRDVPGALAKIATIVAGSGANIEEVIHQRAFTALTAQNVEIELVLQTRGLAHLETVISDLKKSQMEVSVEK